MDEVDDETLTGAFGEQPLQGVHEGVAIKGPRPPRANQPAKCRLTPPRTPYTATYVTGSLPVTASARPCFTSRRRCASASETAMVREP